METPQADPQEEQRHKASSIAIATLHDLHNKKIELSELTEDRRIICTRHLLHEGNYTLYEIGTILGVCERTIARYKKKIREGQELAALVIDEAQFAYDLMDDAELCCARLKKARKYKDAFEVKIKLLEKLQSMGMIKKVAEKFNLKGSLDLLHVLELEAQTRDDESPDYGEENNGQHLTNGNGHSGSHPQGSSRVEELS